MTAFNLLRIVFPFKTTHIYVGGFMTKEYESGLLPTYNYNTD